MSGMSCWQTWQYVGQVFRPVMNTCICLRVLLVAEGIVAIAVDGAAVPVVEGLFCCVWTVACGEFLFKAELAGLEL